ncbi:MAG TPA: Ig domain-containing protein [Candidatus Dormibacteraeota bacterium]|nr:Ig domain-containing protein [Candidatus Dormibacteraeota bacterium]
MKRLRLAAAFSLTLAMALLAGCGGRSGSTISIEIIPPQITTPLGTQLGTTVDVGSTQALTYTAALADDIKNEGVTWALTGSSCSGNGCGTLSNATKYTVAYTPPPAPLPSSAALSVTLTATSVAQTSVTQTVTINVETLPTFTSTQCNPAGVTNPCGLPSGANGVGYNQPISVTGGVGPYAFAATNVVINGGASLLAADCLNLTVTQTTNTSTAIAGTPCNAGTGQSGTGPTAISFTVQVTDSGGAPAITQAFTMSLTAAPALAITTPSPLPTANLKTMYNWPIRKNGGVTPITWTVSAGGLPPGLSIAPTTGVISGVPDDSDVTSTNCAAPSNQNGNYCFSVTVTDSARIPTNNAQPPTTANQTKTQAYVMTVQTPSPLSITPSTPPSGTTATGYSAILQVTGGVSPFTWSVTQGQLPAGLTLAANNNGNGVIAGVPTVTGTYNFTVQVADGEVTPRTATASYSIKINAGQDNNGLLSGSYSFIFHGFDKDGSVAMIGTITADGQGNITSGAEVINRISGVAPVASVSGTYSIDSTGTPNGTAGDGRGTMQLVATIGAQEVVTSQYELALQPDGSVQFIQDHSYYPSQPAPVSPDAFATHGAGVMKPAVSGSFGTINFSGNYAFEFTGQDLNKKPVALVGSVHADGSQTFAPGTADFNDAGNYGSQSITGSFAYNSGLGSAQFTLEVPKTGQQTLDFEYVFVSSSDLYFIETDYTGAANTPTLYRMSGEMIQQQPGTTFGQSSLSGGAVATTSGTDTGGNGVVSAGLLGPTAPATAIVCDGNAPNSLVFDQNDGGTLTSPNIADTCTVNPNNGRVAFNWQSPAVTPPFAAAYLFAPREGFAISNDATVSTGLLEPQNGAPFSVSSVSGAYAIGSPFITEPGVNNLLGVVVSNGAGALNGFVDEAAASGAAQTLNQGFASAITAIAANGRGTMTTNSPVPAGFPTNWIFYVVPPGQIRAITADSGNQHPQLIFLGPDTP